MSGPICEFLTDESKLARGWFAKKSNGTLTTVFNKDATSFCAIGLLAKFHYGEDVIQASISEKVKKLNEKVGDSVTIWSDNAPFEEVKAVFCELGW